MKTFRVDEFETDPVEINGAMDCAVSVSLPFEGITLESEILAWDDDFSDGFVVRIDDHQS